MRFPPVPQHLFIEWLNGLARVPVGGRPVVRTGVQVSVFSGRLHRIPRTYPRFWAGLRALKLPIYPFFGPAYRPGPPRFIRTAGRPLCVYSGVLLSDAMAVVCIVGTVNDADEFASVVTTRACGLPRKEVIGSNLPCVTIAATKREIKSS